MVDMIEIKPGLIVNRDNINDIRSNLSKYDRSANLVISFLDATGRTYIYNDVRDMQLAYNKLLKNK